MARDHARILLSIWDDPDWLALNSVQHDVYWAIASGRDLSYCGVAPLIPARYQHIASDMNPRRFMSAVDVLEARRFVVTDRATAEVLIRSYVRHDGILKLPNVTKALVTAMKRVHSGLIQEAMTEELVRLYIENPTEKGWHGFADADPEGFAILKAKCSPKGSGKGSANSKATPFPLSPTPSPLVSSEASS